MSFRVLGSAGGASGGITQAEADARYVQQAGGTMVGPLILPLDPALPTHAANKGYVDGTAVAAGGVGPWSTFATGISGSVQARWVLGPTNSVQLKGYMNRSDNGVIADNEIIGTVDPAFRAGHQNHFTVSASNFTGTAWGTADMSISEIDGALRVRHLPGTPADVATLWVDGVGYSRD